MCMSRDICWMALTIWSAAVLASRTLATTGVALFVRNIFLNDGASLTQNRRKIDHFLDDSR